MFDEMCKSCTVVSFGEPLNYDIIVDKENRIVKFGGIELTYYVRHIRTRTLMYQMFNDHPDLPKEGVRNPLWFKKLMKIATETLKCRPSRFTAKVQAKIYELWDVKPEHTNILKDFLYCYTIRRADRSLIEQYHKHIKIIEEYLSDDLYHLIPIALVTGLNAHEACKLFGKKLWKKFCSNTKSRNKILMKRFVCQHMAYFHKSRFLTGEYTDKSIMEMREMMFKLSNVSSSILKCPDLYPNENCYVYINRVLTQKKELSKVKKSDILNIANLYRDTKHMAEQLNVNFNDSWTIEKMIKKHDEYTESILTEKYSKEEFDWLKPVKLNMRNDSYIAEIIKSTYSINALGRNQHHCVGSYANMVKDQTYLVIKISDINGNILSTLGIDIVRDTSKLIFKFGQHYGACNSNVGDELDKFAKKIVESLNRMNIPKMKIIEKTKSSDDFFAPWDNLNL